MKIFTLILLVLAVSCQKQPESVQLDKEKMNYPIVENVQFIYGDFEPSDDDELVSLLEDFDYEIENEIVDSRPIAEALWVLEAYLGGFLIDVSKKFTDVEQFELYLEFDEDGTNGAGDILLDGEDLLAAFEEAMEYPDLQLDPDEVTFIDLIYDSEENDVHTFKLVFFAGDKTDDDRDNELSSYSGGDRNPIYNTSLSCSNTPNNDNAVYEIINNAYWGYGPSFYGCGPGQQLSITNIGSSFGNVPTDAYGNGTFASENKLYWKTHDNCISAGGISDGGIDNTVNGWINESNSVYIELDQWWINSVFDRRCLFLAYGQYVTGTDKGWIFYSYVGKVSCVPSSIFN